MCYYLFKWIKIPIGLRNCKLLFVISLVFTDFLTRLVWKMQRNVIFWRTRVTCFHLFWWSFFEFVCKKNDVVVSRACTDVGADNVGATIFFIENRLSWTIQENHFSLSFIIFFCLGQFVEINFSLSFIILLVLDN